MGESCNRARKMVQMVRNKTEEISSYVNKRVQQISPPKPPETKCGENCSAEEYLRQEIEKAEEVLNLNGSKFRETSVDLGLLEPEIQCGDKSEEVQDEEAHVNHEEKEQETESKESELMEDDPEYIDEVKFSEGGRSKRKGQKKNEMKKIRHSANGKQWKISCNHTSENSVCKIDTLDSSEIDTFFRNLYDNKSKVDQDKYLLNFMLVSHPQRIRRKDVSEYKRQPKKPRESRLTIQYYLKNKQGKNIDVCSKTFESITNISRNRLNRVAKSFFLTQKSPMEKRGGSRVTEKDINISESIVRFIESFKCKKSHYIRKDSGRTYLHPELSVTKMYKLWKRQREKKEEPAASFSKFYFEFTHKFNVGFGHPRQDVCSYCTEMKIKIKRASNEEKAKLNQELSVHKAKAKKFFQLLKENNPDSITVSFDMMQNQPLPKLNVTDVFYSRQIWLYNLTFVLCSANESKESSFLYTWLETEAARGPNEICSCLNDFLLTLENKILQDNMEHPPTTLRLFSDSCSAQNKNMFVMTLLLNFVNRSKVFKKIEHYFPVRGHSYMPADRVFGRIEKKLRKKSQIISPTEYHKIFSQFANVKVYGQDFSFSNFKTTTKNIIKTLPFKTTEQKVFTYLAGKQTVGVSQTYSGTPIRVSVLKKGKSALNLNPQPQPKENHVKEPKRIDVTKLMKFVEIPDDAKEFYQDVISKSGDLAGDEDNVEEYDEDEDVI